MSTHFIQNGYDRCSLQRQRQTLLEKSMETGTALFLIIFDEKVGIRKSNDGFEAGFVDINVIPTEKRSKIIGTFLGEVQGRPIFGLHCDETPQEYYGFDDNALLFMELKKVTPYLPKMHASIVGYAQAMTHWHLNHQFCGVCGNATITQESGHVRVCTYDECKNKSFPRTNPAVIVLIHNGESCLLGRQKGWPDRQYSTIAGFVEPGETPEQAVYREVYEETGTIVRKVRYISSQPWPFPASLMLGFTAQADTGLITMKDDELQDARWFTRDELLDWIPSGKIKMPTKISIAFKLIENWFNDGSEVTLEYLCKNQ